MTEFSTFGLPAQLNDALSRMNYKEATPIQTQAIPSALEGRDVLGSAQTGTGKTAAFAIPLIAHLLNNPEANALVMTPTRELATQVMTVANQLGGRDIRTALLIGGEPMPKQFKQLNGRPRLIIGTPGRINDHLRRNRRMLETTNFLVLDEADRMLDMGFTVQIDEVFKMMPSERQTLMFSATFPSKIVEFSRRYMNNPVRAAVQSQKPTAENIDHQVVQTTVGEKYNDLIKELVARDGSVIIFVKTKHGADKMARRLQNDEQSAEAIHGDLKQSKRDRVIREFRDKKHRILVATDVAARGLDVPHVEHVINYDLPQVAEDYIHRIGRTARAGAKGHAMCFVTSADQNQWSFIARVLEPGGENAGGDYRSFAKKGGGGSRNGSGGGYQGNKGRPANRGKDFGKGRDFSKGPKREWSRDSRPQERSETRSDAPRGDFKPRRDDGFKPRNNGPQESRSENRGDWNNKPRSEGNFKPRGEGSFKPRSEGDFKPRRDDNRGEKSYKPRDENRSDAPRGEYKPRTENGFKPRGDFKPRSDNGFKPRSEGNFKPRGEGSFKPRSEGDFKPRRDDNRGEKSFKPRDENRSDAPRGEYKPRTDNGFKPRSEGNFKPRPDTRDDNRGNRGEIRSEPRGAFKPKEKTVWKIKPRNESRFKPREDNRSDAGNKPYFKKKEEDFKPTGDQAAKKKFGGGFGRKPKREGEAA